MADIFVSYTHSDREWAHWIGAELKVLGHTPHIHEWEIAGGGDIYGWMEQRHDAADHVLCVVSDDYLKAPYSTLERNAAIWQAAGKRSGFVRLQTTSAAANCSAFQRMPRVYVSANSCRNAKRRRQRRFRGKSLPSP